AAPRGPPSRSRTAGSSAPRWPDPRTTRAPSRDTSGRRCSRSRPASARRAPRPRRAPPRPTRTSGRGCACAVGDTRTSRRRGGSLGQSRRWLRAKLPPAEASCRVGPGKRSGRKAAERAASRRRAESIRTWPKSASSSERRPPGPSFRSLRASPTPFGGASTALARSARRDGDAERLGEVGQGLVGHRELGGEPLAEALGGGEREVDHRHVAARLDAVSAQDVEDAADLERELDVAEALLAHALDVLGDLALVDRVV